MAEMVWRVDAVMEKLELSVKNCKGCEILPNLQANKLASTFYECWQKRQNFWLRDREQFIIYNNSSNQSIILFFAPVPWNLIPTGFFNKSQVDAINAVVFYHSRGTLSLENLYLFVICPTFDPDGGIVFIILDSKQTYSQLS